MRMMSERIIGAKEEAADAKLCSRVRTSPCGYRAEDRWIGRSSSRIDYNNTRKMRKADKAEGRTHTQSLPSAQERQKAETEVAEFRRFQQLNRDFVEVNTAICQLRTVESVAPCAAHPYPPVTTNGVLETNAA